MPIPIGSISSIAQKWKTVTPTRVADYERGVRNPRRSWKDATLASLNAWYTAMLRQSTAIRWGNGINRAGDQGWQQGAITKGVPRWAQGIQASGDKYQTGFAPYRDVIANLDLPPRGPAGDPNNLERVRIVAAALHAKKLSGQGGGF